MKNALLFRFMLICSVILLGMTLLSTVQYILWERQQATDQRGEDVMAVAGFVKREAERALGERLDTQTLEQTITAFEQTLRMRIFVVSDQSKETLLPNIDDVPAIKAYRQDVARAALGTPVLRRRLAPDGEVGYAQMLYCLPLEQKEGYVGAVVVLASLETLDATYDAGRFFILFMSIGSMLLALCLIGLFAYRHLRPISELEMAIVKLSAGENPEAVFSAGKHEVTSIVNIFNYMQQNFVEAEAARREFLAGVSHDLRSPLTSIYGYTKAMRDGIIKPEDYPKTLDIITREVQTLIKLTGDVLEAAKMEYGRLKLFKEYVPLGSLMREIVESLNTYEDIEKQVKCDEEVVVYADIGRLRQIFTNVIANACKYNKPNGQVKITVLRKGAMGVVEVEDTGIGVSEADQMHIFEKFYRADKSRNRKKEGSGLGLYVTKKLVEQHQGRIYFRSKLGEGSMVTVELPV